MHESFPRQNTSSRLELPCTRLPLGLFIHLICYGWPIEWSSMHLWSVDDMILNIPPHSTPHNESAVRLFTLVSAIRWRLDHISSHRYIAFFCCSCCRHHSCCCCPCCCCCCPPCCCCCCCCCCCLPHCCCCCSYPLQTPAAAVSAAQRRPLFLFLLLLFPS